MINRREVLAFIALHTDEASAPHLVSFREYNYEGRDWHMVELNVDSEAAVRFWADVFGHGAHSFMRFDHPQPDGSIWTTYHSQDDGWRGFTTKVQAAVEGNANDPLGDAVARQLREIAGGKSGGAR